MSTDSTHGDQNSDRGAGGATRRNILAGAGVAMVGWEAGPDLSELLIPEAPAAIPAPGKDEMAVTLLGTGTPGPVPDRFGPATLVEAGGPNLLFTPAAAPRSVSTSSIFRSARASTHYFSEAPVERSGLFWRS
jgi:hypothetical protein